MVSNRSSLAAVALAATMSMALAPARAADELRYPDLNGQWSRAHAHSQWDPSKPRGLAQQAPLTPEYQAFYEASLADQEHGGAKGHGVGVKFKVEVDRKTPPRKVYQPGHPDADGDGIVAFPAIDLTKEFVNALEASRAYEANVATIDITKGMYSQALKILA